MRIRDAGAFIGALESGEFTKDLSHQITTALKQLKEMAGDRPKAKAKGKVVVTFEMEVEAGTTTITCSIDPKLPKMPRASSFFWVLDDGTVSTEHPQQINMQLGPRPVRESETA